MQGAVEEINLFLALFFLPPVRSHGSGFGGGGSE